MTAKQQSRPSTCPPTAADNQNKLQSVTLHLEARREPGFFCLWEYNHRIRRDSDRGSSVEGIGRTIYLLAAAAVFGCLLAYGIALNGPLFFDDVHNLLDNPQVQIDGTAFDDWRVAALSSDSGLLFRPIAMLTFAVNHAAAGSFTPFSLKATNLAVHLAVAALVYLFGRALLDTPALRRHGLSAYQKQLVAMIAASIWLLHPIHVSTVLYAVQRMAQLSTLFSLAGLLVFTRYRLRWAEAGATPGEMMAATVWLLLLAMLSVFSKENGALLPWLIAVVEVALFQGIWRGYSRPRLVWFGVLALLMPLAVVVSVALLAPELLPGNYSRRHFTFEERLLTQARILWQYLSWLALPNIVDMGFFHDDIPLSRNLWSPTTTVISLFAWLGVLVLSLMWRKRYPLTAFAFLFYLVAHAMESTVLPLELVFEHRNYLPSVGFALLAAVGIFRSAGRLRLRTVVAGLLALLVVLLAVRTYAWRDEMALARFEVVNHPQSARANFLYGNAMFARLLKAGRLGLDEEETRALAVTSRRHFERMHTINGNEFAALVKLYQLDTQYFPGLARKNDWLGAMEALAKTSPLQSSDRTALAALVEFSLTPTGAPERDRVGRLLDQLAERFPSNLDVFSYRYRFAMAGSDSRKAALQSELHRITQLNPDSQRSAAFLAEYHGTENLAVTYEALRDWLERDPYRRNLPVILEIFDN